MTNHPSLQELELFILGDAPRDPEAFRKHVSSCPACAARLAGEARLEELAHAAGAARVAVPNAGIRRPVDVVLRHAVAALLAARVFAWWTGARQRNAPEPLDDSYARAGYDVVAPSYVCLRTTVPGGDEGADAGKVPGS